ncbi:hypothetical protein RB195_009452 [Necator americanus]|uniref:Endonuclease/exonuclease/phosphatase domain-containing protein n=1 Tax=Necator americanus TaxID=51031 RepID=A0ABR1CTD0_NECAM
MSKIPSQQVVFVGIEANAKMGLEQQSDVLPRLRGIIDVMAGLDYVLARNIPQSDIRKSRVVWDVAFDSDHHPVLLSFKIRSHKRNRGVPLQPKIDMAGRSRETIPALLPRKKFAFASAETKSTYNSVCVLRSTSDFNQEKRLRRKLRRQLQQDRDNEWTSRAMEFEKVREDRNLWKAYALLKQCRGKIKKCSPVLNTANGVVVGEATFPIWGTLQDFAEPPSTDTSELEHFHRPKYAVNQEPTTGSEDSKKYRGISLLRVMHKVLESINLDRLIKNREETTRDDKLAFVMADLRLTRCSSSGEWAAFDSPHRGRLLNALLADGVPGKFVRLLGDMNQRTAVAV